MIIIPVLFTPDNCRYMTSIMCLGSHQIYILCCLKMSLLSTKDSNIRYTHGTILYCGSMNLGNSLVFCMKTSNFLEIVELGLTTEPTKLDYRTDLGCGPNLLLPSFHVPTLYGKPGILSFTFPHMENVRNLITNWEKP